MHLEHPGSDPVVFGYIFYVDFPERTKCLSDDRSGIYSLPRHAAFKIFPADGPVIHHRRRQQCVDALDVYKRQIQYLIHQQTGSFSLQLFFKQTDKLRVIRNLFYLIFQQFQLLLMELLFQLCAFFL